MSTSLGPSSNEPPHHAATSWRPKAKGTAEQGIMYGLSTSTSPVLHRSCHYPQSQSHQSPASPSLTPKTNTLHTIPYSQVHLQSPPSFPSSKNLTLPKTLRLMQPHPLKTFFDICLPQTPSPVLVSPLRNLEYPQNFIITDPSCHTGGSCS